MKRSKIQIIRILILTSLAGIPATDAQADFWRPENHEVVIRHYTKMGEYTLVRTLPDGTKVLRVTPPDGPGAYMKRENLGDVKSLLSCLFRPEGKRVKLMMEGNTDPDEAPLMPTAILTDEDLAEEVGPVLRGLLTDPLREGETSEQRSVEKAKALGWDNQPGITTGMIQAAGTSGLLDAIIQLMFVPSGWK